VFCLCLESISSTFYACVIHMKVLHRDFLYLHFGFMTFWPKNIGKKSARRMLMKLTPGYFMNMWPYKAATSSVREIGISLKIKLHRRKVQIIIDLSGLVQKICCKNIEVLTKIEILYKIFQFLKLHESKIVNITNLLYEKNLKKVICLESVNQI